MKSLWNYVLRHPWLGITKDLFFTLAWKNIKHISVKKWTQTPVGLQWKNSIWFYGIWCNVYIRVGELYKFQSSAIYRLFTHTGLTTPTRKRIYTRLYCYTGDFSYIVKKWFCFCRRDWTGNHPVLLEGKDLPSAIQNISFSGTKMQCIKPGITKCGKLNYQTGN